MMLRATSFAHVLNLIISKLKADMHLDSYSYLFSLLVFYLIAAVFFFVDAARV